MVARKNFVAPSALDMHLCATRMVGGSLARTALALRVYWELTRACVRSGVSPLSCARVARGGLDELDTATCERVLVDLATPSGPAPHVVFTGDMMGMPMMGPRAAAMDPKVMAEMLKMRGEIMKAMGDVMMKHGRRMQDKAK